MIEDLLPGSLWERVAPLRDILGISRIAMGPQRNRVHQRPVPLIGERKGLRAPLLEHRNNIIIGSPLHGSGSPSASKNRRNRRDAVLPVGR